jgi:hypothetical protein
LQIKEKKMKSSKIISLIAVAALGLVVTPALDAKMNGFDHQSGQGKKGKTNTNANPDNKGQTTTSGPKGALKNGNTPDGTVTTCGPGNGKNGC